MPQLKHMQSARIAEFSSFRYRWYRADSKHLRHCFLGWFPEHDCRVPAGAEGQLILEIRQAMFDPGVQLPVPGALRAAAATLREVREVHLLDRVCRRFRHPPADASELIFRVERATLPNVRFKLLPRRMIACQLQESTV